MTVGMLENWLSSLKVMIQNLLKKIKGGNFSCIKPNWAVLKKDWVWNW